MWRLGNADVSKTEVARTEEVKAVSGQVRRHSPGRTVPIPFCHPDGSRFARRTRSGCLRGSGEVAPSAPPTLNCESGDLSRVAVQQQSGYSTSARLGVKLRREPVAEPRARRWPMVWRARRPPRPRPARPEGCAGCPRCRAIRCRGRYRRPLDRRVGDR